MERGRKKEMKLNSWKQYIQNKEWETEIYCGIKMDEAYFKPE